MLDRLLSIYRTLGYEEHGWTRLLGVDTEGAGLGLEILVDPGIEDSPPQRWAIHCTECLDFSFSGAERRTNDYLRLHEPPHVMLAWYTEVHTSLYFSRPPTDAVGAAYALEEARRALSGGFSRVPAVGCGMPSDRFLAVGYGQIAEGPVSWMAEYARVLERFGAGPSTLEQQHTRTNRRPDVRALTLGGSFMVGASFDALLLSPPE